MNSVKELEDYIQQERSIAYLEGKEDVLQSICKEIDNVTMWSEYSVLTKVLERYKYPVPQFKVKR